MAEKKLCCGQMPKRKNASSKEPLPENPEIPNGVELIYLGAGYMKITGKASGLTYYVSDHLRKFVAAEDDSNEILRMKSFILRP